MEERACIKQERRRVEKGVWPHQEAGHTRLMAAEVLT